MAKTLKELSYTEQNEFSELIYGWLGCYTDEVIRRVLPRLEEILNNDSTMHLLRELNRRRDVEREEELSTMKALINMTAEHRDIPDYMELHNHVLEHSKSYRDVLCDLYINGEVK